MKRISNLFIILCLAAITLSTVAQTPKRYVVAFYNVENVFDTINDPDVDDDEFLPNSVKRWDSQKYWKKMGNLDRVFYGIAASCKSYPTIIGVSEIENRNVLEDLVAQEKMSRANYQIVHYDSPERRGVDVALMYRPDQFKYEGSYPIHVTFTGIPNTKTRDVLSVWGTIEGERFCFFVTHMPSRLGGQAASESRRIDVARIIRHAADSIMAERPDTKIVIMGDMNDDPIDKSLAEAIGGKQKVKDITKGGMYNPFYDMYKAGFGTLAYGDAWNVFDNLIVNENLLNATTGSLKLYKSDENKFYGNIFTRPFMLQQSGQYKNYPLRTFVGSSFQGGYSDHFPVYIYIAK